MDFDSIPDDSENINHQSKPDNIIPKVKSMDFDSMPEDKPSDKNLLDFDSIPDETEKYNTPLQQIGAGVEGVAKGFAGPIATGLELGLSKLGVPGLSAEEQRNREEANPWTHGIGNVAGNVVSLVTGFGPLGWLSKGANAVVDATKLAESSTAAAKIGSAAIKGLIEMSGLGASDEVSKWMLGQGDPEAPVASALANVGANGLFGAATGGVLSLGGISAGSLLKKIANTKLGNKASQGLAELGKEWDILEKVPNKIDALYKELSDFVGSTSNANSDIFGSEGLKNQEITQLTKDIPSNQVASHIEKVKGIFNKLPESIKKDPSLQEAIQSFESKIGTESLNDLITANKQYAQPDEVFKATDLLKRQFQEWAQYNKQITPLSEQPFRNAAKNIASSLKDSLEDSKIWGDAGNLQKEVNKAFSEYIDPFKDFRSNFMRNSKDEGWIVDPQRIKTYINQLGKTGVESLDEAGNPVELRPKFLKKYIDSAEKYRDKMNDLYSLRGLENPFGAAPLNVAKQTFDEVTPMMKLARELHGPGVAKLVSKGAGIAAGILAGHKTGYTGAEAAGANVGLYLSGKLTPIIDNWVGRPIKSTVVPAIFRTLSENTPTALGEALEHADNIAKGNSSMEAAVNSLFTGSKLSQHSYQASEQRDKEKIRKFVKEGGLNEQIQNSLQKTNAQPIQPEIPHFAEGGEVHNNVEPKKQEIASGEKNGLSIAYPEHAMLMSAAKARVYNYLNSLKPQENQAQLPFDKVHKNPEQEKSYDKALNIADKPLSILKHIQDGTIESEHIKHMTQMWPEVHNQLSKKITEKMMKAQLNDEKLPAYHVRQGLSMLLGTPLDSNMTPPSIQAAQSVFAVQKATTQPMPITKNKKNTSKLGEISKQYQTTAQAAASRQTTER